MPPPLPSLHSIPHNHSFPYSLYIWLRWKWEDGRVIWSSMCGMVWKNMARHSKTRKCWENRDWCAWRHGDEIEIEREQSQANKLQRGRIRRRRRSNYSGNWGDEESSIGELSIIQHHTIPDTWSSVSLSSFVLTNSATRLMVPSLPTFCKRECRVLYTLLVIVRVSKEDGVKSVGE